MDNNTGRTPTGRLRKVPEGLAKLVNGNGGYASGQPRRLKWTCRFCERHFETWTRRGLRVTCPHCRHVQEGPAGIQRLIDAQDKLRGTKPPTPATTVKVISVSNGHKTPAAKPHPVPQSTPAANLTKAQPKPPAPAAPPVAAAKKKDIISRALGF